MNESQKRLAGALAVLLLLSAAAVVVYWPDLRARGRAAAVDAEAARALTVQPASGSVVGATPPAVDWPWWRGPVGDGRATDTKAATSWSDSDHILWRSPVGGRGHSSPAVRGERVFLTTADEQASTQQLLCFHRDTGKRLWETVVHRGPLMHRHGKNSHASPTAATDEQQVYVAFISADALWVTAVGFDGKIIWQKSAGPFKSQHGYGSSPVLYKNLVIVSGDNQGPGYLTALDRHTGQLVWRTPRSERPSYGTPIIAHVAGRQQLLLSGASTVSSYDPDTGARLWYCDGPTEVTACTMAFGLNIVYATGGFPGKQIMAIRADGSGNVTDTHVLWHTKDSVSYVPSPLFHDGRLYIVNDQGIATCFDGESGRVLWKKRIGGNFSSSPILVGDKIYVSNEEGTTFVFRAAPKYELIAENKLPDAIFATPAVVGGRIYLRTGSTLYCIGEGSPASAEVTVRPRSRMQRAANSGSVSSR